MTTRAEILAFLNANPACHLATVDRNQPRVRGMLMYRADENGILFHTGTNKDLFRQLVANPHVEFCFNDFKTNQQVRVSGVAERVEDRKLKEEIVAHRDFMKPIVEEYGYEVIAVFRATKCRATLWTFATNFAPKTYIDLS